MNETDLRTTVLDAFAEVAPDADLGAVDESRSFHDQFEIDSVDFLNFVLTLERRLSVHIPEADYPRLSTPAGATDYLARLTSRSPRETAE